MSPSDGSKVQPDPASGAFADIGPNCKRLKARLAKKKKKKKKNNNNNPNPNPKQIITSVEDVFLFITLFLFNFDKKLLD